MSCHKIKIAGSRSTTSTVGPEPLNVHRVSSRQEKTNELESSGVSFEPANRHPAPGKESAPLLASASAITGEQAATCNRQLWPPERGVKNLGRGMPESVVWEEVESLNIRVM
jgi:hypothetical protein